MTYEIMYCPVCGTQSEVEHIRTYPDSTKKKLKCRICGHMIYMEITELQMGHRRGDLMDSDRLAMIRQLIRNHDTFRIGQRGIACDVIYNSLTDLWIVTVERAQLQGGSKEIEIKHMKNGRDYLILEGSLSVDLTAYGKVTKL